MSISDTYSWMPADELAELRTAVQQGSVSIPVIVEKRIEPTWQADGVTLYLGDCLDVLTTLETGSVDAVVTDPPYGQDWDNSGGMTAAGGWVQHEKLGWDLTRPSRETFLAILSLERPTAIWGGNYFTDLLPPSSKWLIWDKGQTDFSLADVEVAWCSWGGAMRRVVYPRSHAIRDGRFHPTQKPAAVMQWNIDQLPPRTLTIADPFMGSGTTGVACIRTGRKFIGVEKEPKYFEIAVKRIKAELERAPLFDPAPKIADARSLFT